MQPPRSHGCIYAVKADQLASPASERPFVGGIDAGILPTSAKLRRAASAGERRATGGITA